MTFHDESDAKAGRVGDGPPVGLAGAIEGGVHRLGVRVYYADTDFSGVVYHARYLEFLERGRSDFLRLKGIHHAELHGRADSEAIVWVVRRMEIDFRAPARMDDVLTVDTRVAEARGARILMTQRIFRGEEVLISAEVHAAIIGRDGRPKRMPKDWAAAFAGTR